MMVILDNRSRFSVLNTIFAKIGAYKKNLRIIDTNSRIEQKIEENF